MTTCARPGCRETLVAWLDRRYCSRRCRTLDVAPDRARSEMFGGNRADRAAYHQAREEMAMAGRVTTIFQSKSDRDVAAMKQAWRVWGHW